MKRAASIILILILLILVMLSTFSIAFECGHDCSHDDCPICCFISQCEQVLHKLGSAIISCVAIGISLQIIAIQLGYFESIVLTDSLVSNKVRLND